LAQHGKLMTDGGQTPTGTLVLVVGPSGAGKDTLLRLARRRLATDPRFVFPRRIITRKSGDHEDHDTLDAAGFAAAAADGDFLLDWSAHGLSYGVPASAAADLATGRTVVVNVSRSVVAQAQSRFPHLHVVVVTAPPVVLAQRIAARGRELDVDARSRLTREAAPLPPGVAVTTIVNDADPEPAAQALVDLLLSTQDTSP
jgi:ribose 1,5-bisphosphokinase